MNQSYAQFVARFQKTAERVLDTEDTDSILVRQIALENANAACRAALRGRTKSLDLTCRTGCCPKNLLQIWAGWTFC